MLAMQQPASLTQEFFATARFNMIESQLRPNRIIDAKILEAFGRIPREDFLGDDQKIFAYSDEDLPVGAERKLMAPMTLARLIQELNIKPDERVLDIGANTGYAAAILDDLAGETVALETDTGLLRQLRENKRQHGLEQVSAVQGTLSDGFPQASPFQAVLIEGAIQWLPEKIVNQMAEGARLACVVYPEQVMPGTIGTARIYEKKYGLLSERTLFDAAAPLLPGFTIKPKFQF